MRRAVLLDREVAQVRVVADEELGHRVDEMIGLGRAEAVEHGGLGVLAERDDRVRERRAAVAFAPVQHEDRILDHDAVGNLHERAAGEERVVQHGERVFGAARRARRAARARRRRRTSRCRRPARPWPRAPGSISWWTTRPSRTTSIAACGPASAAHGPPPGARSSPGRPSSASANGR